MSDEKITKKIDIELCEFEDGTWVAIARSARLAGSVKGDSAKDAVNALLDSYEKILEHEDLLYEHIDAGNHADDAGSTAANFLKKLLEHVADNKSAKGCLCGECPTDNEDGIPDDKLN